MEMERSLCTETIEWLQEKYAVAAICAEGNMIVIDPEVDKVVSNDMNTDWVKEHFDLFGKEFNLFDGM